MDTQPAFGFRQLFSHVVGDMAKAVSERNGETKQQQLLRTQAAAYTIMGFLPRDVIEAMLAGHCVMLHELMTDSVRDTLRGEVGTMRRATRSGIVAMDKAFGGNLTRLERYQTRPSDGSRDEAAPLPVEVPVAAAAVMADVEAPAVAPRTNDNQEASAAAIAACRANPEAMAALEAGDPERFARAMGIDMPTEEYLAAAAAPGSPFDRGRAKPTTG
jgi:hypothetical protein